MNIKVTSPNDILSDHYEKVFHAIEIELQKVVKESPTSNSHSVYMWEQYGYDTEKKIKEVYEKAGWSEVTLTEGNYNNGMDDGVTRIDFRSNV